MSAMVSMALAQLSPRLRDTDTNAETIRGVVAGNPEADLIFFPELFLSGYTVSGIDELAVKANSPELKCVADAAREHSTALVFGAAERVGGGVANSAFCVDESGDVVGIYRKVQLYDAEEGAAFVAGEELLVVGLRGVKVGIMICFDVEFPEVARALARAGAELLVTISANMEPFGNDHAVFASARALENGLPHAYVNQVGPGDGNLVFAGGSRVVSPDGEIHAQASSSEEEVPSVELVLPARSNVRQDYLSELRSPMPGVKTVPSGARLGVRARNQ